MRNSKKGFTIVELVIVIAVIAILAAVLIPTFSGIIDNANKSAAEQEARNAYTNYLASTVAEGKTDILDKVCVFVNGYYVFLDNGSVDSSATVKGKETPDASFKGEITAIDKKTFKATAAPNDVKGYQCFTIEDGNLKVASGN